MEAVAVATPVHAAAPWQIHHYPALLIETRQLPGLGQVLLRPVLPQDGELIGELINRLSFEQRRLRFHGGIKPSPRLLTRLSCVDYQRDLGLVMTAEIDGAETVIADARFSVDAEDADAAEFALMVDPRFQRHGLGRWAMQALQAAAARQGLHWLHGSVLTNNTAMLALMQACGYSLTPDRADDELMNGDLAVHHAPRATAPGRWSRLRQAWPSHASH